MKTRKILYTIFVLASVFGLISCGNNAKSTREVTQESSHRENEEVNIVALTSAQSRTAGIELGKVERKQISGTIKVNGVLDVPPQQLVSVSVPLGGFIKNTSFSKHQLGIEPELKTIG